MTVDTMLQDAKARIAAREKAIDDLANAIRSLSPDQQDILFLALAEAMRAKGDVTATVASTERVRREPMSWSNNGKVLRFLRLSKVGILPREAVDATNVSKDNVHKVLSELRAKGFAEKRGDLWFPAKEEP